MASRKSGRGVADALTDFERLKAPEMTRWARAMIDAANDLEEPEKGFLSEEELAKEFGMSRQGIRPHILRLMDEGKIEVKKFKVECGARRMKISHYRLKK